MLFTARPAEAADLFQQFADVSRSLGHRSMTARALQIGAHALVDLGELGRARRSVEEGLPTSIELQDRFVLQIALTALAGIAFKSARPARAIKLTGAAQGYCDLWEVGMPAVLQTRLEAWMAPARKLVGAGWERLYTAGKQMSLEEAIAYALSDAPEDSTAAGRGAALTRREQEVARLAATGLTNRDIAARLHLSVRTVEVHVDHVLTKLGFNNRTQLAAWAYEEKLLPEIT
jgi:non-specific serine/threonine protein kinase